MLECFREKKNMLNIIVVFLLTTFIICMSGCAENQDGEETITNEKAFRDENTVTEERNASTEAKLNFDGLYCCIGDFNSNGLIDNYVLMFYEDGSVITVTVEQTEDGGRYFPKKKWFSKDADRYKDLLGQYIIDGTDISFTGISEYGTVDYWGTIENNKLLLSSHSNINGNDSYREYSFYSFDEIPEWE